MNARILGFALLMAAAAMADSGDRSAPPLYAFCVGMGVQGAPPLPLAAQAAMLRELGYDGIGWELWPASEVDANLESLDAAKLPLRMVWTTLNVNPNHPHPHRNDLPEALRKLKGRPVTVCLMLVGLPPGDPRGMAPALRMLRELGDVAAGAGLRLSIYHHAGDWTERAGFAAEVAGRADHPQVGVNFNLCHWLKHEGDQDWRPFLRKHAGRIFAVTLNGATTTAEDWENGLVQPLDQGNFDTGELLGVLAETGYHGSVGLMCYSIPGDPRTHLSRSIRRWRELHQAPFPRPPVRPNGSLGGRPQKAD